MSDVHVQSYVPDYDGAEEELAKELRKYHEQKGRNVVGNRLEGPGREFVVRRPVREALADERAVLNEDFPASIRDITSDSLRILADAVDRYSESGPAHQSSYEIRKSTNPGPMRLSGDLVIFNAELSPGQLANGEDKDIAHIVEDTLEPLAEKNAERGEESHYKGFGEISNPPEMERVWDY